ncbi:MAG: hypothetical protein Q8910_01600 [Bacteroidota bacterium]|nr:hypothetical protein [Bacteroidota bacterium]
MENEETTDVEEYSFDLSEMQTTSNIVKMHQEGNYLVCTAENGIRFRKHIPQGKILHMIDGKYVLKDMEIVQGN